MPLRPHAGFAQFLGRTPCPDDIHPYAVLAWGYVICSHCFAFPRIPKCWGVRKHYTWLPRHPTFGD